jgi:peptidoglycan/LPS O-acetylase OafA/YrhL
MVTRTIEEESGARSEPPSPISSAWMPGKLSAAASDSLDLIRALAACAVMVGHLRALFFVDFRQLSHKSWPLEALYFFTGFGHQAVIVFFVLSGFLISSTVIRSHVLGKWSWRDYAVNRATRLYVVLIPGLLFGFFWDRLGSWLFAAKGIYAQPLSDLGPAVPLQNLTAGNFLGNFLFLQTILFNTFGSNAPLWSLANEFWYYVLFPVGLAACLAWARRRFHLALPFTCLAIFIGAFIGRGILIGFLIWLAGCGLVFLYSRVEIRSRLAALGLLCNWIHFSATLRSASSSRSFCLHCSSLRSAGILRPTRPSCIASRAFPTVFTCCTFPFCFSSAPGWFPWNAGIPPRRTFSMPHPSVRGAFFSPGWFHLLQKQRPLLLERS